MSNAPKPGSNNTAMQPLAPAQDPPPARETARTLGLRRRQATAYYRRALKNYAEDNLEDALVDVSEAIYNDPGFAEYYAARGIFFLAQGKKEEAEVDLQYALTRNRRLWLAQYGMGVVRFTEGDYLAALDRFNEAMRHPDARKKAEVWYYRAVVQHILNQDEKAHEDIEKAVALFPAEDRKRALDLNKWKKEIEARLPKSKAVSKPARRQKEPPKDAAASKDTSRGRGKKATGTQAATSTKDFADELREKAKDAPLLGE